MSIFNLASDMKSEVEGVWLSLGTARFLIARMGPNNARFKKLFEKKIAPLRKAYELGLVPDDKLLAITKETFAEANVLKAEVLRKGEWIAGLDVEDDADAVQPYAPDVLIGILNDPKMHAFWKTLLEFSMDSRPYAAVIRTTDETGN